MVQATVVALPGSDPSARETKRSPSELMEAAMRRGACGGCAYDGGAAMSASGMKKTKGASEGGGMGDLGFGQGGSGDALILPESRGIADTSPRGASMAWMPATTPRLPVAGGWG